MANSIISDVMSRAYAPLKGFIEVTHDGRRVLIAISNIVGLTENDAKLCTLTPAQHVVGLGGQLGKVVLEHSYDEIVQLLKNAQ